MTTPDAELNKALWLDKTAFLHLKKTEQDVDKLRAALPKALVLTNVSPEPEFAAETEKSLLFAQRVKKVKLGKARRDVKYKGAGTAVGAKRTASRGGRRA